MHTTNHIVSVPFASRLKQDPKIHLLLRHVIREIKTVEYVKVDTAARKMERPNL